MSYQNVQASDESLRRSENVLQRFERINDLFEDWNIVKDEIDDGTKLQKLIRIRNSYSGECTRAKGDVSKYRQWIENQPTSVNEEFDDGLTLLLSICDSRTKVMTRYIEGQKSAEELGELGELLLPFFI